MCFHEVEIVWKTIILIVVSGEHITIAITISLTLSPLKNFVSSAVTPFQLNQDIQVNYSIDITFYWVDFWEKNEVLVDGHVWCPYDSQEIQALGVILQAGIRVVYWIQGLPVWVKMVVHLWSSRRSVKDI